VTLHPRTLCSAEDSFFDRDVKSVRRFFKRRFRYEAQDWPTWKDVLAGPDEDEEDEETAEQGREGGAGDAAAAEETTEGATKTDKGKQRLRLDEQVEASGWAGDMQKQLEEVSCPGFLRRGEAQSTVYGCRGRSASV